MPGRGLQKKEIKSIRTDKKNKYARSPEQKKARNDKQRERRHIKKIELLTAENKQLSKSNAKLGQALLSKFDTKRRKTTRKEN